jgi:putative ABC transport system substrate-binding protein
MDRRRFTTALAVTLLTAPLAAEAQQAGKIPRIGLLVPGGTSGQVGPSGRHAPGVVEAFRQGMRDLGYIEGRNLVVDYRSAGGRAERLPELLAELVGLEVDVIVTGGTAAALAAKQATGTIPVVIGAMGDPVESGVVSSLAHPGGNITGFSLAMSEEFVAKHLEIIKQAVPNASRVAVLWHSSMRIQVRDMERAAQTLGVRLQSIEVQQPGQLDRAFASLTAKRAAALVVVGDPFTFTHREQIVNLAAKHRLPAIYGFRAFVDDGGLFAYAANLSDLWRRAATYVDKILKGAKPRDLPVEQATTFELVINMKTAKALGLTIPPSLLLRADQIIE